MILLILLNADTVLFLKSGIVDNLSRYRNNNVFSYMPCVFECGSLQTSYEHIAHASPELSPLTDLIHDNCHLKATRIIC